MPCVHAGRSLQQSNLAMGRFCHSHHPTHATSDSKRVYGAERVWVKRDSIERPIALEPRRAASGRGGLFHWTFALRRCAGGLEAGFPRWSAFSSGD